MRNAYKIFMQKPETKRPIRRPLRRWGDIIEKNVKKCDVRV
jgi:hypothetical protein